MMVIWFMVTRNPNGISHEKFMINLDGLNGYNAIHGPWGKNSWPKAKCSESPPFPEPSADTDVTYVTYVFMQRLSITESGYLQ